MPGRNPAQAFDAFVGPLQRAASCLTRTPLLTSPSGRQPGGIRSLTFARGEPIGLPSSRGVVWLHLGMRYEIIRTDEVDRGPWKVRTHSYTYTLTTADETEALAFHWHPESSGVSWPHLHVGKVNLAPNGVVTHKQHIPTERISVEAIVRFCIGELDVSPQRDDWKSILHESEERFRMWRSWP